MNCSYNSDDQGANSDDVELGDAGSSTSLNRASKSNMCKLTVMLAMAGCCTTHILTAFMGAVAQQQTHFLPPATTHTMDSSNGVEVDMLVRSASNASLAAPGYGSLFVAAMFMAPGAVDAVTDLAAAGVAQAWNYLKP